MFDENKNQDNIYVHHVRAVLCIQIGKPTNATSKKLRVDLLCFFSLYFLFRGNFRKYRDHSRPLESIISIFQWLKMLILSLAFSDLAVGLIGQ